MDFWLNVAYNYKTGQILLRAIEDGMRVTRKIQFRPTMYVMAGSGDEPTHRTISGAPMIEKRFQGVSECRKWMEENQGLVAGYDRWAYQYIAHRYPGKIEHDPGMVRVAYLDIETMADSGFPDISVADKEITLISFKIGDRLRSFGWRPCSVDPRIEYRESPDERSMLLDFLSVWSSPDVCPDIISGWHIEGFDIPYMVHRIMAVLGEEYANLLSPWGILVDDRIETQGKTRTVYTPLGISVLDYKRLYQKLAVATRAVDTPDDYRLNTIAHNELGERKIDYSEFESLHDLYLNDYDKFVEYNAVDVELVERINDKRQIIELVMAMAYGAKVNYEDMLGSVKPWECIIHHVLLARNIVVPIKERNEAGDIGLVGAYVKPPRVGGYDWVVSFDLNSLYPMLINQFNIGAEQKLPESSRDWLMTAIREEKARRGRR